MLSNTLIHFQYIVLISIPIGIVFCRFLPSHVFRFLSELPSVGFTFDG